MVQLLCNDSQTYLVFTMLEHPFFLMLRCSYIRQNTSYVLQCQMHSP